MSPQIIIALVISAASFGGGFAAAWKIHKGIDAEKEIERVQQTLRTVQESAARDIRKLDNVIVAQNSATLRARVLRNDADSARTALVGLSHAAASALLAAQADHATCIDRASALGDVLQTIAIERRELSEKADRHTNDIQTLIEICSGND